MVAPRNVERSCRLHFTQAVDGDNIHLVHIATLVRKFMAEPSNIIFHTDPNNTKSNNIMEHCLVGGTENVMTLATRVD